MKETQPYGRSYQRDLRPNRASSAEPTLTTISRTFRNFCIAVRPANEVDELRHLPKVREQRLIDQRGHRSQRLTHAAKPANQHKLIHELDHLQRPKRGEYGLGGHAYNRIIETRDRFEAPLGVRVSGGRTAPLSADRTGQTPLRASCFRP